MNVGVWLQATSVVLGLCAIPILIEYAIDRIFDNGEDNEHYR